MNKQHTIHATQRAASRASHLACHEVEVAYFGGAQQHLQLQLANGGVGATAVVQ